MDKALDSDEPPADGSHIGGELPYILAGLGAVWLVSMGLMAVNSFLNQRRQHMEAQRDIERLQVVQGGRVTLETLDSTSPAENYKFSQSSELHPSLQLQTLDTLELWKLAVLGVLLVVNSRYYFVYNIVRNSDLCYTWNSLLNGRRVYQRDNVLICVVVIIYCSRAGFSQSHNTWLAQTYSAHWADKYLERPGYQNLENGWAISSNDTMMASVRSEAPQVTVEQYDWWSCWHSIDDVSSGAPLLIVTPTACLTRQTGRTRATLSAISELPPTLTSTLEVKMPRSAFSLLIETMGFNKTPWPEKGIETIAALMEYRTRCTKSDVCEMAIARFALGSPQLGHDLSVHCNVEMTRK
ncbi:uncharacterized protein B0J16DRAFT_322483 [Fusarium flagelliforme]|uniref:uncharacterized protein n=1 Tax=Fusarium flagelliforme TaxID=2675880 RepID=UPI001E8EE03B|nr:uncharacterized protein B0J16DRAFT_322483 [Fusarium flagelliforme]KAH7178993.1 hypothetical protein B0J16DRAFT_322483 [Fusarium flagelliforme]